MAHFTLGAHKPCGPRGLGAQMMVQFRVIFLFKTLGLVRLRLAHRVSCHPPEDLHNSIRLDQFRV